MDCLSGTFDSRASSPADEACTIVLRLMTLDVTNFPAVSARAQTSRPEEIRFNRLLVTGKIDLFRVVNCKRVGFVETCL